MLKDKQALVSIIVPVYNVEIYLEQCVESLINQTYKNIEILLIDDGSKDTSSMLCDKMAEKDSRIQVIHKENGGLSDARNVGIQISKGKYLGFVDSDDWVKTNMFESLVTACEQKKNPDRSLRNGAGLSKSRRCFYSTIFRNIDPRKSAYRIV